MSEDAFEYVWRIIKADDDEMMRRLEEGMLSDQTHPNECEECGQPGELSNYPDDSICDDCMSAHADAVDPLAENPTSGYGVNSLLISHIDSVILDVESGESSGRVSDTLRQIRMGLIQGEYNE